LPDLKERVERCLEALTKDKKKDDGVPWRTVGVP
jgi:hypothetical protein